VDNKRQEYYNDNQTKIIDAFYGLALGFILSGIGGFLDFVVFFGYFFDNNINYKISVPVSFIVFYGFLAVTALVIRKVSSKRKFILIGVLLSFAMILLLPGSWWSIFSFIAAK